MNHYKMLKNITYLDETCQLLPQVRLRQVGSTIYLSRYSFNQLCFGQSSLFPLLKRVTI